MLCHQVWKAQVELHSHRKWSSTFRWIGAGKHTQQVQPARAQESKNERPTRLRSEAQLRKHARYEGRKAGTSISLRLSTFRLRADLLQAAKDGDTQAMIRIYSQLPSMKPLTSNDFAVVAQSIHQAFRLRKRDQEKATDGRPNTTDDIIAFTQTLASDIRQGHLLPSATAHLHLLGIFKEARSVHAGVEFWRWLETQDDRHVRTDTYTVAIETMAILGTPLPELEALFRRALIRFPGSFYAYHLSPHSILPDRNGMAPVKGLPLGLLQAISFARLLRGDSRNAYLALETALRLRPVGAPIPLFRPFFEERPLSEAYTVYAMMCRAGYQVHRNICKSLIRDLRLSSRSSAQIPTVSSHVATIRAMLAAVYLQLGSSGVVLASSLGELIVATTSLLRMPGVPQMSDEERKRLVDEALTTVQRLLEIFARYGALPPRYALDALLFNVAGHGRSKETVEIVRRDLNMLGIEPNDISRRCLLTVAGMLKDQDFVQRSWKDIVEACIAQKRWPEDTDFLALAKSTRAAGNSGFAQEQFDSLKDLIPRSSHEGIQSAIDTEGDQVPVSEEGPVSSDELLDGFDKVNADVSWIDEQTREKPDAIDFSKQELPMRLLPPQGALRTSEEYTRQIYDELTTESSQPAPPSAELPSQLEVNPLTHSDNEKNGKDGNDGKSFSSSTSVTYADLRYENWKCTNYLLQLAERHDDEYNKEVDDAITAGEKPPPKFTSITQAELEEMASFGLTEKEAKHANGPSIEETRAEIRRLRGMESS